MEAVFLRGCLKNQNRDNNYEVTFHANTTEITFFSIAAGWLFNPLDGAKCLLPNEVGQ